MEISLFRQGLHTFKILIFPCEIVLTFDITTQQFLAANCPRSAHLVLVSCRWLLKTCGELGFTCERK